MKKDINKYEVVSHSRKGYIIQNDYELYIMIRLDAVQMLTKNSVIGATLCGSAHLDETEVYQHYVIDHFLLFPLT